MGLLLRLTNFSSLGIGCRGYRRLPTEPLGEYQLVDIGEVGGQSHVLWYRHLEHVVCIQTTTVGVHKTLQRVKQALV